MFEIRIKTSKIYPYDMPAEDYFCGDNFSDIETESGAIDFCEIFNAYNNDAHAYIYYY